MFEETFTKATRCLHQLLRQGHRCYLGTDEAGWYWRKGTPAPDAFPIDDAPIGRLFQADPRALASLIRRETRPLAKLAARIGARPGRLSLDFHESGRGVVSLFGQDRILLGPFLPGRGRDRWATESLSQLSATKATIPLESSARAPR